MPDVQANETKQILVALGRLEENFKNMNAKIDELSMVSTLVVQTEQSAKSAHNRIDDIKFDFDKKLLDLKEDYEEKIRDQKESLQELKGHITWLWRAVGSGIISFIFAVILFFVQKNG